MGFYLTTPIKEKDTSSGKFKKISYAASSMQGWRTSMEDAHITKLQFNDNPDRHLFAVFDGHGGKEVAEYCEKNFESILKQDPMLNKDMEQALKNTFKRIDENLLAISKDCYFTSGCTANVLVIDKDNIIIANVGDSRSVLAKKSGKSIQLSTDHKPELKDELARIKGAGGEVYLGRVNGNLNLSRAVGDLEYKKNKALSYDKQLIISVPEITKRKIEKDDDFILMGCDGVYELFNNDELVQKIKGFMMKKMKKQEIIQDFLDQIIAPDTTSFEFKIKIMIFKDGTGCDNMSAIIIKLNLE